MTPKKIKVLPDNKLQIIWNDNSESIIRLANIKRNCPCAVCDSEREKQSSSYLPIYADWDLKIKAIDKIGIYAISITWEDGHNTGIYEFNTLAKMAENAPS
ncbi:MAG: DUF971 domain-containing protein [Melioribacteraceae bacterium]